MGKTLTFQYVAGLVYPSSGDINKTIKLLIDNGLSGWVSPLHAPDDSEKEEHYHIMNVRPDRRGLSLKMWRDIADVCGYANGYVKILDYPHAYARYLLHLGDNNKDKQQFPNQTVTIFGDPPNYDEFKDMIDGKKKVNAVENNTLAEIIKFCNDNAVSNYASLLNWCIANDMSWFDVASHNSQVLIAYMRSMEYAWGNRYQGDKRDMLSDKQEEKVVSIFTGRSESVLSDSDIQTLEVLCDEGLVL